MKKYMIVAALLFATSAFAADCISIEQAAKQVGSNACVTGKVLKVGRSKSGTTFLDFCEDAKTCPFVVVIFARDLRDVGDVKQLEGKTVEISGKIEEYNGRAEIILKDVKQLHGETANIPPLPKNYDVEKHGNFSATSNAPSSSSKASTTKKKTDQGGSADE
jgi:DNA/RNA endonuclease YhcR with UshA esterase domain